MKTVLLMSAMAGAALAQQMATPEEDKTLFVANAAPTVHYTAPGLRDKFGMFHNSLGSSSLGLNGGAVNGGVDGGVDGGVNGGNGVNNGGGAGVTGGVSGGYNGGSLFSLTGQAHTPLGHLTAWVGDIVYPMAIGGIAVFAFYIFFQLVFQVNF